VCEVDGDCNGSLDYAFIIFSKPLIPTHCLEIPCFIGQARFSNGRFLCIREGKGGKVELY
jgi:hypothetical protein